MCHPKIRPNYDIFVVNAAVYPVMLCVKVRNLLELIATIPLLNPGHLRLSEYHLMHVVEQMLRAMHYLHSVGVIHCDKAETVLATSSENVNLTYF